MNFWQLDTNFGCSCLENFLRGKTENLECLTCCYVSTELMNQLNSVEILCTY